MEFPGSLEEAFDGSGGKRDQDKVRLMRLQVVLQDRSGWEKIASWHQVQANDPHANLHVRQWP